MRQLKLAFDSVRSGYQPYPNYKARIKRLKDLYTQTSRDHDILTWDLSNNLDSLVDRPDEELTIALHELCIFSRVSAAIMKACPVFHEYRVEAIKKATNEYDIYLIPKLNSGNSDVGFGHFDYEKGNLIQESDSNITVKISADHYFIRNNNPKTKNGHIRIKNANNTFNYYPFSMN